MKLNSESRTVENWSLAVVCVIALAACSPRSETSTSAPVQAVMRAKTPAFDFTMQVGVASFLQRDRTDGCLAMVNQSVAPGTKVTLVGPADDTYLPNDAVNLGVATVTERLTADCGKSHLSSYDIPSTEVLREPAYYRIETAENWTGSLYVFAIVPPAGDVALTGRTPHGDLDGDGTAESFRSCATSEGSHLQIWSGEPFSGRPRWHWYVYAGYDTAVTCTGKDYFGPKKQHPGTSSIARPSQRLQPTAAGEMLRAAAAEAQR